MMPASVLVIVRRAWPAVSLILILATMLALVLVFGTSGLSRTFTEAMILMIVVIGLYIFIGNSGVLSFGHISFMSIGAYATAWQTCCPALKAYTMNGLPDLLLHNTFPVLPAGLAAALLAAVVALVAGAAIMRLSGVAASIATLAMLFIVYVVYSNWESVTRGKGSLVGLPTYVSPIVAFVCVCVAIVLAYAYQQSRFGLALRASREDAVAARAAGVNIYVQRLIAFTLSGFVVGVGGVLHGHFLGTISVESYFLSMTLMTLAMLVVGGMRSLAGAVAGVLVLTAIVEMFRRLEAGVEILQTTVAMPSGMQELALALAMLLILTYRPSGIMGGREIPWPFASADAPQAKASWASSQLRSATDKQSTGPNV